MLDHLNSYWFGLFLSSACLTFVLQGYGKKWENLPVNKNGKVIRVKMHVKVGDYVVVIAGSEKGKKGEITKVCYLLVITSHHLKLALFPHLNTVVALFETSGIAAQEFRCTLLDRVLSEDIGN